MNVRARWTLAAFAAATGTIAHAAPGNVLVIVLDDVGPELLGCYDAYFASIGKPSGTPANTPAIDDLIAARGMMFTRAWASPSCSPTRAQILTGRRPARTGVGAALRRSHPDSAIGLSPSEILLPEMLRAAPLAFTSAAVGKWHLASTDQLLQDAQHPLGSPAGRWFDRFAGSMFNLRAVPSSPPAQTGYFGWTKHYATRVQLGVDPCPDGAPPCRVNVACPPIEGYATVDTANDALALIAELPEPWFIWTAFNAMHEPFHDVPAGLPAGACAGYSAPANPCSTGPTATGPMRARCMLEAADTQIGRLMCAIDGSDTTVILVGDNGTPRQARLPPYPPNHSKGAMYEGGVHVPLIVRSPWIDPGLAGTSCDAPVQATDLFATVCELGGVPAALVAAEDSRSLVPYLTGQVAGSMRATVYAEVFKPNFAPDEQTGRPPPGYVGLTHEQALRDRRFKLIRVTWRVAGTEIVDRRHELYDLVFGGPVDPQTGQPTPDWFESNDLLGPAAPPLGPIAAAAYARLKARMNAAFPTLVH
jgi:arylsulfatase A-like enzyme